MPTLVRAFTQPPLIHLFAILVISLGVHLAVSERTQYLSTACVDGPLSYVATVTSKYSSAVCQIFTPSDICQGSGPADPAEEPAIPCDKLTPQVVGPAVQLTRLTYPDYSDEISAPGGIHRPSTRAISNIVSAQNSSIPNSLRLSDWFWQWGQWTDHDLSLSTTNSSEAMNIPVPAGDSMMDPTDTGQVTLTFTRSQYFSWTGTNTSNCRQQLSIISPLIDSSQVYASEPNRAICLRAYDDVGSLQTSPGSMLPYDWRQLPQGQDPDARPLRKLFVAGDVRVNEHIGLMTLHTLMMREHNRLARNCKNANPSLSGNECFAKAKAMVIATAQRITYEQWLPLLLGTDKPALNPYVGYISSTVPYVSMEFASAAFRIGHSMLSPSLRLIDPLGTFNYTILLEDAFFNISIVQRLGIDPIILGFASQVCQDVDPFVVDGVRNFLFRVTSGSLDLVAVNLQRGRDHGIPSYNAVRVALGLSARSNFSEISSNPVIVDRLSHAYASVNDIDLYIGGLAEDHVNGGIVGETFFTIIVNQFTRTRDADPNFYLDNAQVQQDLATYGGSTTLADIIKANTKITNIQDNVFIVPS